MIAHSIKPVELPLKDLLVAKRLVQNAYRHEKEGRGSSDADYEFLRNSPVSIDQIPEEATHNTCHEI